MSEKYHKYNHHHKVPKSRWWTNHWDNMERMRVNKHRALHHLFENKTVTEKIRTILEMDKSVLQGDLLRDIERILNLYEWLEYHSHCKK